MKSPYKALAGNHFFSEWEDVQKKLGDFVVGNKAVNPIDESSVIAIYGSCFASGMINELNELGIKTMNLNCIEAIQASKNLYSSDVGEIYTPQQFIQLLEKKDHVVNCKDTIYKHNKEKHYVDGLFPGDILATKKYINS